MSPRKGAEVKPHDANPGSGTLPLVHVPAQGTTNPVLVELLKVTVFPLVP